MQISSVWFSNSPKPEEKISLRNEDLSDLKFSGSEYAKPRNHREALLGRKQEIQELQEREKRAGGLTPRDRERLKYLQLQETQREGRREMPFVRNDQT